MSSLRVYFVTHGERRLSGTLMRRSDRFLEDPPPAAFGRDEEEVLAQLEGAVVAIEAKGPVEIARYLWEGRFELRSVEVAIHPHSVVAETSVIGKRVIPLRVSFAWTKLDSGALLVMLPRFGWRFILEDLDIAARVIKQTIAASMAGTEPKWIYDYRHDGDEYVRAWAPGLIEGARFGSDASDLGMPVVAEVAEELVSRAAQKKLPFCVGSDSTIADHAALFERELLPSLLLVGPSGVGKTTFVHALAEHFLAVKRGKRGRRRTVRIWSTSTARVVAGMSYLGMWQKRCLTLIEELSHEGDYLYLDRLVDVLAPQTDGSSVGDLLLAAMLAGEVSVIVECDEGELVHAQQTNASFVERLHVVRVEELSQGALIELLTEYLAPPRMGLEVSASALRRMMNLLRAFRPDQCFPGKAIQLFEWLSKQRDAPHRLSTPRAAAEAFSRHSGLPIELISDEVPAGSEVIAARLSRRVVGQRDACITTARVLARFKAGLNDPQRPVGTLFFVGPTGVGKTELAKQLARYMFGHAERMVRIDMGELMTPGSADRLLDVSPGVKSLATRVRAEPLTVVLLDEIEKAHPEVFDLLLGVLGEGRLTDARGRLIDFRMTIIVMTSNLGASAAHPMGFGAQARGRDRGGLVAQHFRPEFVARLDEVVEFRALALSDMTQIVDLLVGQLRGRVGLIQRGIELSMSDDARIRLAELGFDGELGARPLARVIEERVITPLAARLAEDPHYSGHHVRIVSGPPGPHEISVG